MSNLTDFFGGNGRTRKVAIYNSGTSWAVPANLVEGLVSVTMIGGGQAQIYVSTSNFSGGFGGSVITEQLYAVSPGASVTYSIGAPGGGVVGASGTDTTFGTLIAVGGKTFGGAASPYKNVGAPGGSNIYGRGKSGAGKYGCYSNYGGFGGGGIMLNGNYYGTGGGLGPADAQRVAKSGAIYLQWVEQIV